MIFVFEIRNRNLMVVVIISFVVQKMYKSFWTLRTFETTHLQITNCIRKQRTHIITTTQIRLQLQQIDYTNKQR